MPTTRAILDSSPLPAPKPRSLKRSISTASLASLPTPPCTTRKVRRRESSTSRGQKEWVATSQVTQRSTRSSKSFRSHPRGDATRDDGGENNDDCDNDGDGRRPPAAKKLKTLLEQPEDEDAFWVGGGTTMPDGPKTPSNSPPVPAVEQYRARVASQATSSLASPPPSKRQVPASTPSRPRRARTKRNGRPDFDSDDEEVSRGVLKDSPENPFLAGDDSLPEIERSPTPQQGEQPTVLYVFRGMRRVFANPYYDPSKPNGVRANPNSLLPPEHPDFSPSEVCKPKMLFKAERRRRVAERRASSPTSPTPKRGPAPLVTNGESDDDLEPVTPTRSTFEPKAEPPLLAATPARKKAFAKVSAPASGVRRSPRLLSRQ